MLFLSCFLTFLFLFVFIYIFGELCFSYRILSFLTKHMQILGIKVPVVLMSHLELSVSYFRKNFKRFNIKLIYPLLQQCSVSTHFTIIFQENLTSMVSMIMPQLKAPSREQNNVSSPPTTWKD